MRRNHVLELKRETRACEQPSALSLTILIFQFALNCHIYLNLILVGLKEWAAGRSSKEEKSLLEKKTDTTTSKSEIRSVWKRRVLKFFDRWIFHRLTWRLTQSHLDDVYQEDFRFSFSCSCYGEIFFYNNVQFTAKPCLNQQITTSLFFCCARLSGVMEMIWFMPTTYQPVRVIKSFDTHVLLEADDDFAEWNYWESSGTLSAAAPAIWDEEDEEEDGEVQTQL